MEMENSFISFTLTRGPIRGKDRNRIGLVVKVRARQDIEDFASGLSQGRKIPVDAVAETWQNCDPNAGPLEFYESDSRFEQNRLYTLDSIGGPLIIAPEQNNRRAGQQLGDEQVNLAFLRLAGISSPVGVTIGFTGVYSNDYAKRVNSLLMPALKQFLHDYIVPVTFNLHVISKS
jgi:hypothetical protein